MPRIERQAEAIWQGRVATGGGMIAGRSSGSFDLAYSEPTRVGDPAGQTSPEELVAAAHAGCYAMSLAAEISKLRAEPRRLSVTATCVMDEVEDGTLVCLGQGPTLYQGVRSELEYYFGPSFVEELDAIEATHARR